MRILIYEPRVGGHFLHYVRAVIEGLRGEGNDIVLLLNQSVQSSEDFRIHLECFAEAVAIDLVRGPTRSSHSNLRDLHGGFVDDLEDGIRRLRPDYLIVPSADGIAQVLGLRRALSRRSRLQGLVGAEGMLLRGVFAYIKRGAKATVRAQLSFWAATRAGFTRLHYQDPLVVDRLNCFGATQHDVFPDPVETFKRRDREAVCKDFGLPIGRRWGLVPGIQDQRKGTDLLLEAVRACSLQQDDSFLLAGPCSADVRRLLAEKYAREVAGHRIVILDRYLSPQEIQDLINVSEFVCAPHPSQVGSSSTVLRAVAAGKPVLTADQGWAKYMVDRFELGWCCNVRNANVFAADITRMFSEGRFHQVSPQALRLVEFHSPENFGRHWAKGIRALRGQPPDENLIPWTWVTSGLDA